MTDQKGTGTDWRGYLIEALKEDVASREAEVDAIRSSLRYRVGGWVLEAWPPRPRTLLIFTRMLVGFLRLRRRGKSAEKEAVSSALNAEQDWLADTVVFGQDVPEAYVGLEAARFDDPMALAALLDNDRPAGRLILRRADQAITRRVERLRAAGWQVVWWPKDEQAQAAPQHAYLAAHADEFPNGTPL